MNAGLKIEGRLLAKNAVVNFFGQSIPLLVALITIPYIIHHLGMERFGVLSLAWVTLVYFGLFNLGLGRATIKFVSEALGKGETGRLPAIVWTSLFTQSIFGIIGGLILVAVTPVLVKGVLKISPNLIEETQITFYLLGALVPILICSRSLRGVLEAGQRFDLVNLVQIPSGSLNYLIPAIGIIIGLKLPGIILLLLIAWIITTWVYLLLCFKVFPSLRERICIDRTMFRPLFRYGGWIAICNMLFPVLIYIDRLLIAAMVSVTAVAYYSAPYEAVSKLLIFPSALAMTLFPAFSTLWATHNKKALERLYACSLKYIILVMGPVVLIAVFFAEDILGIWLGKDFAAKTTIVFQILAVGMLMNALAQMQANLIDGVGRPDIRAKIYLSYVPLYIVVLWFLISHLGIVGAALAWTLRAAVELLLFFVASRNLLHVSPIAFAESRLLRGIMAYGGLILVVTLNIFLGKGVVIQGIATTVALMFFALIAWKFTLDSGERESVSLTINQLRG